MSDESTMPGADIECVGELIDGMWHDNGCGCEECRQLAWEESEG